MKNFVKNAGTMVGMGALLVICGIICLTTNANASDSAKVNMKKHKKVLSLKTLKMDPDRTLVLEGEVDMLSMDSAIRQLHGLSETSSKPIFMVINGPGGEVISGLDLINTMKILKNEKGIKITCVIYKMAASMDAVISDFCSETYAVRHALLLHHQMSAGVQGNAGQIITQAKNIERFELELEQDISAQIGMSLPSYQFQTRQDWYLTANEAAEIGMIDGVLDYLDYVKPIPKQLDIGDLLRLLP